MHLFDKQIQIINWIKKYLMRVESANIDSALSSFCYFTSWAETPGYARLKLEFTGRFFIFKYWSRTMGRNIVQTIIFYYYFKVYKKNKHTIYRPKYFYFNYNFFISFFIVSLYWS